MMKRSATLDLVPNDDAQNRLKTEVYTEPEAARLLGVAASTLHYWLQGGERNGVVYSPVIRVAPVESRYVTWAEFVEAGWLRTYRQSKIPMKELRAFIEQLRAEFSIPYPLAHRKPLISGKSLVLAAQEASGVSGAWRLVDDQLMLTYPGQSFVNRLAWEGDVAAAWRPDPNPDSTVTISPDVRFGRPQVGGVSTRALFERAEEGATTDEVAEEFDLDRDDVRWALVYENAPKHAA
ncbi:MAG: hypothetical protein JWO46_3343 [Nocardioidaceae bacterium]|nr:hypothetical protein [Nocardioidaceae bacterium]